tara:strand:- start:1408 stop:1662 length:255 start_codon:yes stop_codon:yes gene_type:complete
MSYETEVSGYVTGKNLEEIEVTICVAYECDRDERGYFPIIDCDATYIDEDGYEQDYRLVDSEVDILYDQITEEIRGDEPDRDYY